MISATKKPTFTDRAEMLSAMRAGTANDWDMIIVGGGITGAGVLREAVRRGYKALLLEQKDFAWGTSSRSSKMIHGGLRYLSSGDLGLTKHSLAERERLLREAPGLIDRLGYYFVLRKGGFPGRFAFSILLKIYDFIAGIKDHRYLSNRQLNEKYKGIEQSNLNGACYYTDAVTDDSRLVLRVLQESLAEGGCALNYTKVERLLGDEGTICGVSILLDDETDESAATTIELHASVVVNATGAWADKLRNQVNSEKRVRPLRGSHLVFPRKKFPIDDVLAFFHPEDNRGVFIYEWEGATVVGTTDIDHGDDLDMEAGISQHEVDYLMHTIKSQFPHIQLSEEDVVASFAGVRPVIGSEKSKDPSKERRDHAVWSDHGLITVSGGKLTTFRLIALDVIDMAKPYLGSPQPFKSDAVFSTNGMKELDFGAQNSAWTARAIGRYGAHTGAMLAGAAAKELELIEETLFSLAECRWAIRNEAVRHLDDLLLRRTRIGLLVAQGGEAIFPQLKTIFKQEQGWDDERWNRELERYREIILNCYALPKLLKKHSETT